MTTTQNPLNAPYWTLRIAFGAVPAIAGLDKFTNLLVDWTQYLSPLAESLLPVSPHVFMGAVGVIELLVGLAVLTKFTRIGAYVAAAWLVLVAVQVGAAGYFDVAVRDLVMASAAFTLARIEATRSSPAPAVRPNSALAATG